MFLDISARCLQIPQLFKYIYLGFVICAIIILVLILLCTWEKVQQLLLLFTGYIGRVSASSALVLYRVATYFFPFLLSIGVFLKVKKSMLNETENKL